MAFYCNGKQGICDCDILCADCKFYDDKGGKDVQTNADRIRAMSDEELARFFADKIENEYILSQKRLGYSEHTLTATQIEAIRHNCYCIWMKWLKQPAEVERCYSHGC